MRNGENAQNILKESNAIHVTEAHKEFRFTARNDYAFKLLFGNPENIIILKEFLSVVLNLEKDSFEEIVIENPMVGNYYYEEKKGILDIKLTLRDGQKINIEMQNLWETHYEKRAYYYWARRYLENFKSGEAYRLLPKCISIHILNSEIPFVTEIHSIYQVLNRKNFTLLGEDLEIHFLDLTRLPEEAGDELEKWLRFIETDDKEVRSRLGRENKVMEYANEVMDQFYSNKEERLRYEAAFRYECDRASSLEEGIRIGEKRGRTEGEAHGRHSEKLQTARNMKQDNIPIASIVKYTGLTVEEIAEL